MAPRVSIIVTVYKRTDFLLEALRSALAQTFRDFEILVADDSGEAVARALCEGLAAGPVLRYRANPRNVGIAESLRAALGEARGTYVAILNDDDAWEPEFLARLVPPLDAEPKRVLAFCDHWIMREDGALDRDATEANSRRYGRTGLPEGEVADPGRFVLVTNGVPLAMGSVFRRDALDPALLTREVAGAYDFWISSLLAGSGGRFYYVPARLTRYRVHTGMETARRSHDKSENMVFIYSRLLERNELPALAGHLRARLAEATFRVGRDKLYFHRLGEARACFSRSFRMRPGWKPALGAALTFLPEPLRVRLKLSVPAQAP